MKKIHELDLNFSEIMKKYYDHVDELIMPARITAYLNLVQIPAKNFPNVTLDILEESKRIIPDIIRHVYKIQTLANRKPLNNSEYSKLLDLENRLKSKQANLLMNLMSIHDSMIYILEGDIQKKQSLYSLIKNSKKLSQEDLNVFEGLNFFRNTMAHNLDLSLMINFSQPIFLNKYSLLDILLAFIGIIEKIIIKFAIDNKEELKQKYLDSIDELNKLNEFSPLLKQVPHIFEW